LNILPATIYPRATEEIDQIIEMIGLIEKGYAYESGGDVYFRVQRDEDYGKAVWAASRRYAGRGAD
jgi:cysteinyl-tRNA synthetase